MITTTVVLAAGEAVVWTHNKELLHNDGSPIKLTRHWAKSLLDRMCFVKRKATTSAKVGPSCFAELKEQYLLDIKVVVKMAKVPAELVFNWDHTQEKDMKTARSYTVFVAISNKTATLILIATDAVCTMVGHILNDHGVVGAIVYSAFCAVFSHWTIASTVLTTISPFH